MSEVNVATLAVINNKVTGYVQWTALGVMEHCRLPEGTELIDRKHYDALAAQRDEGLAREAELRKELEDLKEIKAYATMPLRERCDQRKALQQRLAESVERLQESQAELLDMKSEVGFRGFTLGVIGRNDHFLSHVNEDSPGCADGEKP